MNIREAILKAADHIERNPREFRWAEVRIPSQHECGTPGCALGWIGYFANVQAPKERPDCGLSEIDVPAILGLTGDWLGASRRFYREMDAINDDWRNSASACAIALRAYADKHHPAKPVVVPNWQAIAAKQTVSEFAVSEEVARA